LQVFAGTALYLYLPENILLATCTFLPNYYFFVSSVHLLVEAGFGCLVLVASNVFAIANCTFTRRNKNNAPHECGNPKYKAIALLLAIKRTISSPSSTSADCFACKQDSGRAKALGVRRQCQTAPTRMRRGMPWLIVKAAALYTNWLAPGFNIDSRERQAQFYPSPNCPRPILEPWLSKVNAH